MHCKTIITISLINIHHHSYELTFLLRHFDVLLATFKYVIVSLTIVTMTHYTSLTYLITRLCLSTLLTSIAEFIKLHINDFFSNPPSPGSNEQLIDRDSNFHPSFPVPILRDLHGAIFIRDFLKDSAKRCQKLGRQKGPYQHIQPAEAHLQIFSLSH